MKDYQKHIKSTHADHKGESICGVKLEPFDWTFMDVDHAFFAIPQSTTQPCPACVKTVIDVFSSSE